jgi:hypothetical protein
MLRIFGTVRKNQHVEADTHSILGVSNFGDSVKIVARFEGETWKELSNFARQMGYSVMKELLPILFSYGVTDREGVDIEERRSEMFALGSKYAALKFEAYQLFADNRVLSMALSTMLPENRRLRKLAEERGLLPANTEEWDSWDQEKIDDFYEKYVFVR